MDVEFMVSDTLEVGLPSVSSTFVKSEFMYASQMLRPKMTPFKTFQEAAEAIDEMLVAQPFEGKSRLTTSYSRKF
jgi:hypothetical protein